MHSFTSAQLHMVLTREVMKANERFKKSQITDLRSYFVKMQLQVW